MEILVPLLEFGNPTAPRTRNTIFAMCHYLWIEFITEKVYTPGSEYHIKKNRKDWLHFVGCVCVREDVLPKSVVLEMTRVNQRW